VTGVIGEIMDEQQQQVPTALLFDEPSNS